MPLEAGHRLGRYEIRALIGAGGMGEVYLAQDTKLERKVALKLLLGPAAASDDRLRRFAQEARAASALNHPNIVTVHDVDVEGGTHYITTEFIEGETLRKRLQRGRLALSVRRLPLRDHLRFRRRGDDGPGRAHDEEILRNVRHRGNDHIDRDTDRVDRRKITHHDRHENEHARLLGIRYA